MKCDGCKHDFLMLHRFPRRPEHLLCMSCTAKVLVIIKNRYGLAVALGAFTELVPVRGTRWRPRVRRREEFMPC